MAAANSALMRVQVASSATGGAAPPLSTIAFSFFAPITAPIPKRWAWWVRPLTMLAKRTVFSPAGPITAIWASLPNRLSRSSVALSVVSPHCAAASKNVTAPSSIRRPVGRSAAPWKMRAS